MSGASDRSTAKRYIRAARVVTASAKGVIEDGAVAVEGSRITPVGPGWSTPTPTSRWPPTAGRTSRWCWIPTR